MRGGSQYDAGVREGGLADAFPNFRRYGPLLAPVLRWRHAIVAVAALAFCLQHLRGTGDDWRYFVEGSELLFGQHHKYTPLPGGLHLYANYPDYQIGPLSFLLATPFRVLGPGDGRIPAVLAMTAVIPLLVWMLERTALTLWREHARFSQTLLQLTTLLGGVVVAQAWSPLATIYSHLDDVTVLTAGVVALWAVACRRPLVLGAMIGIAIAAKPWGIVVLPLVLALPGWTGRLKAAGLGAAIAAVAWMPFVIGDTNTLSSIRPTTDTSPASVLALFGVGPGLGPSWIRPVQIGTASLVAALVVARGRWTAALLAWIAIRLALDPGVFPYYTAGLAIAAFAWDILKSPRPLPVWTLGTFVFLNNAYIVLDSDTGKAILRLLITVAIVVSTALLPDRRPKEQADPADVEPVESATLPT